MNKPINPRHTLALASLHEAFADQPKVRTTRPAQVVATEFGTGRLILTPQRV
jgi:hypothetical protein